MNIILCFVASFLAGVILGALPYKRPTELYVVMKNDLPVEAFTNMGGAKESVRYRSRLSNSINDGVVRHYTYYSVPFHDKIRG